MSSRPPGRRPRRPARRGRASRRSPPGMERARSQTAGSPQRARLPGRLLFQIAAITDRLVDFAVNVVGDLGLAGIFVLMLLESACIPVPSEATMLFAGFNVDKGDYSLLAVTVAGVAGNVVGSWIAYAVGYFGRIDLLEKHGRALHVKPQHLAWADRWFERHGEATVFFARLLPIIRTFISLPAGVAKMPFWRFTA